jgi:hypothetical protein
MMLIAIGLSAAVIVGVPMLIFSINMVNNTSSYQSAENFANKMFSYVDAVDAQEVTVIEETIIVPLNVTMSSGYKRLDIVYHIPDQAPVGWTEYYQHEIDIIPPNTTGQQMVRIEMNNNTIQIRFIPHP